MLRYFIFIGIPYLTAKRVEKVLLNRLDPEIKAILNEELKRFPEIDGISGKTRYDLKVRGGAGPITIWFTKVFILDFAMKIAIGTGIASTIWSGTADSAASNVIKFGTAIIQSPGNKFKSLYKKLRNIDPQHNQDIREILLDKNLSVKDKLELIRVKVEQTIKTIKGTKRTRFILFVMATLIFFFGGQLTGSATAFTALMERLRALLRMEDAEDLKNALIDVYRGYNSPLPKELAKAIEDIS